METLANSTPNPPSQPAGTLAYLGPAPTRSASAAGCPNSQPPFCYLHKPLLSFPRYIITRPTKPTVHYLPSFSLRPSPSEPPADQRFSREYAPEADHLDAILIDSSRAPTDEAPTPADTVMDEFVSESDSDYTSYWRDWVSLLSLILFDGPHVPAVVAMSTLLYGAS